MRAVLVLLCSSIAVPAAAQSFVMTGETPEMARRREARDIAHQRAIGSYVGLRHAMGLPVRGQNTQTNARTARKLNRIDRYL